VSVRANLVEFGPTTLWMILWSPDSPCGVNDKGAVTTAESLVCLSVSGWAGSGVGFRRPAREPVHDLVTEPPDRVRRRRCHAACRWTGCAIHEDMSMPVPYRRPLGPTTVLSGLVAALAVTMFVLVVLIPVLSEEYRTGVIRGLPDATVAMIATGATALLDVAAFVLFVAKRRTGRPRQSTAVATVVAGWIALWWALIAATTVAERDPGETRLALCSGAVLAGVVAGVLQLIALGLVNGSAED
jgi:hypothetical protein